MKKNFILLILICIIITSCESKDLSNDEATETNISVKDDNITEEIHSDYTGEICSNEEKDTPAFMAMIENSVNSRPQSGLSYADIIYETSAEGGIPRFIALFHDNLPNVIGPIRSVRPYFLTIARAFNLPVAHCGGSEEALTSIDKDKTLMSINEIKEGTYFWRDNSRKAPHNLYTSAENIENYIKDNSLKFTSNKFYSFDKSYFNKENLDICNNLKITVNSNYNTSYTYDNGIYKKYMDSKEAIDILNNEALSFSNIIIEKTDINISNDNLHLDIKLIGEGDGYVLSQGKILPIKWKKASDTSQTLLYDTSGNEISLSPGKTIYHIIDSKNKIDIN